MSTPPAEPEDLTPAPSPAAMGMPRRPARLAYGALGVTCTTLGAIGVAVPGLPTTPFLLLAGFAFSRSSPRLHAWLLSNRVFGPVIRQWHADRSLPPGAKRRGLIVIVLTFSVSIAVLDSWPLRAMLVAIGTAVFTFVARLPEAPRPVAAGDDS
jgi:uncharacterized protein